MAINTVLLINKFSKSVCFKRSFLNMVSEFELIRPSSGNITEKYLMDMSNCERSTTSVSEMV